MIHRREPHRCGTVISRSRWSTVAAALASVGMIWTGQAGGARARAAEPCDGPVARYDVRYRGEDTFEVHARFARPSKRVDLFHFPVAGRPEGQAASVAGLRAFTAGGASVGVSYVGEGTWLFDEEGAVELSYALRADHGQVDWGDGGPGKDEVADVFDGTYLFAGHAFFLQDWDMPRCPVEVRFDIPQGWQVTAPWPATEGGFLVDDTWSLGQNMFAVGEATPQRSTAGGLELTWIHDPQLAEVVPELEGLLAGLPPVYTAFWEASPGNVFNIFLMADTMSDGGAFHDSFAMRLAVPLSEADEVSWSHTLGHELMHIWNDLGKGPQGNVPELEWVNEGFTDYLTIKLRSRAGQLDTELLEQRVANLIRRYRLSAAASPGLGLAGAGADKGANWQLIYGGGALAAMLIDGELSQADPMAFTESMRGLQRSRGQGYTYETFLETFDSLSGGRASEVVAWLDGRPSDAELIARLRRIGIDVSIFGPDEVYVRFTDCGEPDCLPGFLR